MSDTESTTVLPVVDKTAELKAALKVMGEYETPRGVVKFFSFNDKPLVETDEWKLYVAELPEPKGQLGLLMIANTKETNVVVGWQEYVLAVMQSLATSLDEEAGSAEFAPNYGAFFPKVFAHIDADGRDAIVLGYHPVISMYRELKPISVIDTGKRLDLKTATWILGKSLKLATLFHPARRTIGNVAADNVFITLDNPEVHGVFYLDLTYSEENASDEAIRAEISAMAQTAWEVAGGTDEKEPPLDVDIMTTEQHAEFVANLRRLMSGDTSNAQVEMDKLYELNDKIWPKVEIVDGPNSRGQTHKRQFHVLVLRDR